MTGRSWRDLLDVRRTLHEYIVAVLGAMPRPEDPGRTLRIGPDPVRILLVGAGTAAGYGVRSREDALDGALADAVHAATGRGVSVTNRTVPNIRLDGVADSMGSTRGHTFDVVVWAPTYLEVAERLGMASWRRQLTELVEDVHGASRVRIVLLQLPHTTGSRPVAALARRWLPRINREIQRVAESVPGTVAVPVAPAEMAAAGEVVLDREYYRRCAALLLPAVLGEGRGLRAAS